MKQIKAGIALIASCMFMACSSAKETTAQDSINRMNVLFIAVDDLKPLLATYGQKQMKTPHIDRLVKDGLRFDKAYSNIAVCGASRASLITGVRPNAQRFSNYAAWASKDLPGAKPLHATFKENGYETVSLGKIIHHPKDFEAYWDKIDGRINHFQYNDPASIAIANTLRKENSVNQNSLARQGPAYERANVPDNAYTDGEVAEKAIRELRRLKKLGEPFFLAVGFISPHLPFIAPAKYWDMYAPNDIMPASNPFIPKDAPESFIHNSSELRNMYTGIPAEGPIPDTLAKKLIHGYYACVSYTDAMIGKVYSALEALGLKDNTIVVLWSDHGYFLGEHTMWTKHSTFMDAVRIPFVIAAPGLARGGNTLSLAESVDIYPTLCDLAAISAPPYLHGKTLVPILKDPKAVVNDEVYTRYGNQEAVINDRFSYMEIVDENGAVLHNMLYDLRQDPGQNTNVAQLLENKSQVEKFSSQLKKMRDHVNRNPL